MNKCFILIGAFLFLSTSILLAQEKVQVQGVVQNEIGNPISGVTVRVKSKNEGSITDSKGQFIIPALLSDSLVFSSIGYKDEVIIVKNNLHPTITLFASQSSLNQVIVIGYGAQKKEDLTGSVGSANMETIQNQPITSANEALAGQIAGVKINTTNGIPGGGPQIQIRGVAAIGAGSSPLYVVDGFPLPAVSQNGTQIANPLSNIPVSNIASISVLKGPSATAIYGSRAANGVVIIKTKEGTEGQFNFTLDAYTGIQTIPSQIKPDMMNAHEFAQFMKEFIEDNNRVLGRSDTIPTMYKNPSQYGKGTDWYDVLTRQAPIQSITISASGGNKKIKSFFSGNYFRQKGVIKESDYNRVSLRANITADVISKFKVGLNLSPTYSYGRRGVRGSTGRNSFFGEWEYINPIQPVYNSDGSFNSYIDGPMLLGASNPLQGLEEGTNNSKTLNFLGTGYISYNILNGLDIKSSLNVKYFSTNQQTFSPSTVGGFASPPPSQPTGGYNESQYLNWANENQITFNREFSGGHHLSILADFSEQEQIFQSLNFSGREFPDNIIRTLNAAGKVTGGTNMENWSLVSYLGRLNYSYKDKYLFTGTFRRDGSSKFGSESRWGTFPSVSGAWVISKEPWFNNDSWINFFKVRAEYGITGNQQIGTYAYASNVVQANYILNGNILSHGKVVNSLGNSGLTWAQSAEFDVGLDIGFLNNRISFTSDFYRSITKSLLLNVELPASSGFTSSLVNIGKVRNYGLELSIKSINITTKNFIWNSTLNFSLNRNKVLKLGPEGSPIIADAGWGSIYGHSITQIGSPIGLFYGYKQLGLFKDEADVQKSASYAGAVPGALKVVDVNGDGKITPKEDFMVIGSPYPNFQYSMTNTLTYKNFNLNIVFTGSQGAQRFKSIFGTTHNTDGVFNVSRDQLNRYRSPEQPGDGITPTTVGTENRLMYRGMGTWSLRNASYLWIKNISLNYTLPSSILNKYFNSIEAYISVQNVFIFTPYPHGNPAATDYIAGNTLTPGVDWNPYPVPRVSTIGVKFNLK